MAKSLGPVKRKFSPWTDPASVPFIRFENVTKRFGDFTAVDDVTFRVERGEILGFLGTVIGIDTLSPHDCRHYWATRAASEGVSLERLKQAGGWSSVSMPVRYINESDVANKGMGRRRKKAS